jgi:hypothetical protein
MIVIVLPLKYAAAAALADVVADDEEDFAELAGELEPQAARIIDTMTADMAVRSALRGALMVRLPDIVIRAPNLIRIRSSPMTVENIHAP